MAKRSPCYACTAGCDRDEDERRTDPAHVKRSCGANGKSVDLVPLCRRCHAYQHRTSVRALERKYGLPAGSIHREADRLADLVTRAKRGAFHGE